MINDKLQKVYTIRDMNRIVNDVRKSEREKCEKIIKELTRKKVSWFMLHSGSEVLGEIINENNKLKQECEKCEKIIKEQQEQIDQLLKDDTDYTNKLVEAEKKIKELEKEGK